MPRSITFNGQTLYKPGALSRVTASPNRRSNPGSTGIVALIGEADGGTSGIHVFTDPNQVKGALGSGPLADAAAAVFDPSNDPVIPGGAASVVAYKVNAGTRASVYLPSASTVLTSTVAALSTSTAVVWTGAGLTPNAHTGRWLKIGTGAAAQYRRITSNSSSTLQIFPALAGAPTVGDAAAIMANQVNLTSRQYGIAGNQISVEVEAGFLNNSYVFTASNGTVTEQSPWLPGDPYFKLLFTGGPAVADANGAVTAATANSITFTAAGAILQDALAGYVIEVNVPGYGLLRRKINSPAANNAAAMAGDPVTVSLAATSALSADIVTKINATAGLTAKVYAVTAAVASFTGANGVCTGFSATITQDPVSTSDNISITFSSAGLSTLKNLADYINANYNYHAVVADGINPASPLSEMDFGANNTNVVVLTDHLLGTTNPSAKGEFRRDLQTLINWINQSCSLVSATRATGASAEGSELPAFTGGLASNVRDVFVWLVGGTRGVSSNSTWQVGFDALRDYRASQVVPLISEDLANLGQGSTATLESVASQLALHVSQCNGQYKNERGAFIGVNPSKKDPIALSAFFNSRDVQVTFQKFTMMDINGSLVQLPEWSSAVIAAGMRAGGLAESLTRKYPRVTAIDQSFVNPSNRDICNALLMGGVLFAETLPNSVVRWVRDITTYQNDDLETSIDGQTRDVVRYIAYDLRTFIEDSFTGLRVINASAGAPSTISSIRSQAIARLTDYTNRQLLILSQDPLDPTKIVPGFDRVRVTLDGSLLQLSCRIFPSVAINFETLDITTEIPLLTAGA